LDAGGIDVRTRMPESHGVEFGARVSTADRRLGKSRRRERRVLAEPLLTAGHERLVAALEGCKETFFMKVNWLLALATVVASISGSASYVRAQTYTVGTGGEPPIRFTANGCANCNSTNLSGDCGCAGACGCDVDCSEPIRLFPVFPGNITVTGWLDAGGTANAHSPISNYNGTVTFNDRDELMMNQAYAVIQREINTRDYVWDI